MLTKTTAESRLKLGNLKIVQIPNLHKHTQIHSLMNSTKVQNPRRYGGTQQCIKGADIRSTWHTWRTCTDNWWVGSRTPTPPCGRAFN